MNIILILLIIFTIISCFILNDLININDQQLNNTNKLYRRMNHINKINQQNYNHLLHTKTQNKDDKINYTSNSILSNSTHTGSLMPKSL